MTHPGHLKRMLVRAYRLLLKLYPSSFLSEFSDEMQAVFTSALEEQGGEHSLRLFWREIRTWPGSVLRAHLRARRNHMASNGFSGQKPLTRRELLAAMIIFVLPLLSLFATWISLPEWTNYILLVTFWGSILFALGLAFAKRFPSWSLSYLGFALMLGLIFIPFPRLVTWVYPYLLNIFGPSDGWPLALRIAYAGMLNFIFVSMMLLGALLLVNLLRLLPYTRTAWERIRADWTQFSFLLYGGLVFYVMLAFDEYHHEELWKVGAWACLALGAWFYLREKKLKQRALALLGGTTAAFWIVALAKWILIPLQKWPTGYPIAPSETERWTSIADTLLTWLLILGMLIAPALMNWLLPFPNLLPAEEDDPANAQGENVQQPRNV